MNRLCAHSVRWFGFIALICATSACGRLGFQSHPTSDGGNDATDLSLEADASGDASSLGDASGDMSSPSVSGVTVAPISGLITSELGGTATFTVVLDAAPTATVSISLASSDTTEGTVSPSSVTFTSVNWAAPQTVTVTGVDDAEEDGPVGYSIALAPAVSGDARYNGVDPDDVAVSNTDNETAGVTISRTTGLVTSETGASDTFTVTLNAAPTADVQIELTSDDTGEATVSPSTITFTPLNALSPQTVTVTGVDDASRDGNQPFVIVTAPAVSADTHYDGLDADDVSGSNSDDETPGISVSPTTGLSTTEAGGTATFTVALQSEPSADVSMTISSSDTTEGTVSSTPLVFTMTNWSMPQVVTVTGVDDFLVDGAQVYRVDFGAATSSDPDYASLVGASVSLTNQDDETARIVATPLSGLVTSEAGGTATFTLALASQPSASVQLSVTSSNLLEGSVSPGTVTFSTSDWNVPQTVTLTGVNDFAADGDQLYDATVHVASTTDSDYALLSDLHIGATNTDDETVGVTVMPTTGLSTSETGTTDTFTVVLNSQPSASVSISVASDTPSEGVASPASLTFMTGNWNTPQTVTVTGVDDFVADGARLYNIVTAAASSSDTGYSGFNASDVTVTNADNDVAGVSVSTGSITAAETGPAGTFTVVLTSAPTADVTVPLHIADTAQGSVAPASLTFTSSNWNVAQTVTVTAVNDLVADGDFVNTVFTDAAVSADGTYSGMDASNVMVTHTDNDSASVTVTPTSGLVTSEAGGTATFTIVLTSQPTATVTITLSSSTVAEGTVSPGSAVFTTVNWSTPQTITVTGANDSIVDGTVAYSIVTSAASSTDGVYNGMVVADVSVSNTDNDVGGITVTPTSGLVTTEGGAAVTFTIVLLSQPTASVTISLMSSNVSEGTVGAASLTFTTMNWSTPQTVAVTGVNDMIVDGNVAYTIVTGAAVSADPYYSGFAVADVSITNISGWTQLQYLKSATPDTGDIYGVNLAVSSDGTTLAIAAYNEDSSSAGIGGNQLDNSLADSGAVYVYLRSGTSAWVLQAYIKASNPDAGDLFGQSLILSADGNTLAVGAYAESSNATGINGNQTNNSASQAGALYVFTRAGTTWSQQAYIKPSVVSGADWFGTNIALSADGNTMAAGAHGSDIAGGGAGVVYVFTRSGSVWSQQAQIFGSNTGFLDIFGLDVALSSDGNTLAAGAFGEQSNATGIGGNQADNSLSNAGAVYILTRSGTVWTQQAYIKASNTGTGDSFGYFVALSSDGNTLAAGAPYEDSNATGIGGNQADNSVMDSGAVYVFTRSGTVWTQQAYVKASNTGSSDNFGLKVALSANGNLLIVGALGEASNATGVNGNQANNAMPGAGAVYAFTRSGTVWTQQAYLKSSATGASDNFGYKLSLSGDGRTLVVGSNGDDTGGMNTGAVCFFYGL